jgi:hypothetical protein
VTRSENTPSVNGPSGGRSTGASPGSLTVFRRSKATLHRHPERRPVKPTPIKG